MIPDKEGLPIIDPSRGTDTKSLPHASSTGMSTHRDNKPTTASKFLFPRFWSGGKGIWAILAAGATLVFYNVLKPNIVVEPYATQDPGRPFTGQFYIQNNSIYSIRQVAARCGIGNASGDNAVTTNFSIDNSAEPADKLAPGGKSAVHCVLQQAFTNGRNKYSELNIAIGAAYKLPLGFSRCQATHFLGIPARDGTYVWSYSGSSNCAPAGRK